jgi:hypothetical protein
VRPPLHLSGALPLRHVEYSEIGPAQRGAISFMADGLTALSEVTQLRSGQSLNPKCGVSRRRFPSSSVTGFWTQLKWMCRIDSTREHA